MKWERKALHFLVGTCCALFILFSQQLALIVFAGMLAVGIVVSIIEKKQRVPIISFLLDRMERTHDRKVLPGKGFLCMIAGAVFVTALFSQHVAAAAMLILAIGDSLSYITGSYIKKRLQRKENKVWEGALFGTAAATLLASIVVPWTAALVASSVALGVEVKTSSLKTIVFDDNILVPLIAALLLTIVI